MVATRLIVDPPAPGAWNMAVDEALLIDAADNGVATLRFYQWSEPTLSLGYFQRYDDRHQHAASRECAVVRRQTGGGAILHDRELTYSLTLPSAHPLARRAERLYTAVHDAYIGVLTPMIDYTDSRWLLVRRDHESNLAPRDEPFLCFQRRARGDVLLIPNNVEHVARAGKPIPQSTACKILGSAQRRHRGAILQHGSLLLEKSPAAPELAGLRDLIHRATDPGELINALYAGLEDVFNFHRPLGHMPPELESKARQLANTKYAAPTWTKRR